MWGILISPKSSNRRNTVKTKHSTRSKLVVVVYNKKNGGKNFNFCSVWKTLCDIDSFELPIFRNFKLFFEPQGLSSGDPKLRFLLENLFAKPNYFRKSFSIVADMAKWQLLAREQIHFSARALIVHTKSIEALYLHKPLKLLCFLLRCFCTENKIKTVCIRNFVSLRIILYVLFVYYQLKNLKKLPLR